MFGQNRVQAARQKVISLPIKIKIKVKIKSEQAHAEEAVEKRKCLSEFHARL